MPVSCAAAVDTMGGGGHHGWTQLDFLSSHTGQMSANKDTVSHDTTIINIILPVVEICTKHTYTHKTHTQTRVVQIIKLPFYPDFTSVY